MFRRLRGQFAEFLRKEALMGLCLLDALTGVGLGTVWGPRAPRRCHGGRSGYPRKVWHRMTSVSLA